MYARTHNIYLLRLSQIYKHDSGHTAADQRGKTSTSSTKSTFPFQPLRLQNLRICKKRQCCNITFKVEMSNHIDHWVSALPGDAKTIPLKVSTHPPPPS